MQDFSDRTAVCRTELRADLTGPVNGQKATGNTLLFIFFFGGWKEFHPGADWMTPLIGWISVGALWLEGWTQSTFFLKKREKIPKTPPAKTHTHTQTHSDTHSEECVFRSAGTIRLQRSTVFLRRLIFLRVKGSKWPQWNLLFPNVRFKTILNVCLDKNHCVQNYPAESQLAKPMLIVSYKLVLALASLQSESTAVLRTAPESYAACGSRAASQSWRPTLDRQEVRQFCPSCLVSKNKEKVHLK